MVLYPEEQIQKVKMQDKQGLHIKSENGPSLFAYPPSPIPSPMNLPSKIPHYHQKSHREANYAKSSRESNNSKGETLQKANPRHMSRSLSTSSANRVEKSRRAPLSELLAAAVSETHVTSSTKSMSTRQPILQHSMSSTMDRNKQMAYQKDHPHDYNQLSPSADSIRSSFSPGNLNLLRKPSKADQNNLITDNPRESYTRSLSSRKAFSPSLHNHFSNSSIAAQNHVDNESHRQSYTRSFSTKTSLVSTSSPSIYSPKGTNVADSKIIDFTDETAKLHYTRSSSTARSSTSPVSPRLAHRAVDLQQMQYNNPAAILNPLFDLEGVHSEQYNSLNMHYQAADSRLESQKTWNKLGPQTAISNNHAYAQPVLKKNSEAIARDKNVISSISNQKTVTSGYGDHVKKSVSRKHSENEDPDKTVNTVKIVFGETLLDSVTHDIVKKLSELSSSKHGYSLTTIGSAKSLFKRILVLRTHALANNYYQISSDGNKSRALSANNCQIASDKKKRSAYSNNSGDAKQRSSLEIQKAFFDEGMKAFDALVESRERLKEAMESFDDTKVFKVACFGGRCGSSAMAVRLFHIAERPSMEVKVDICGKHKSASEHHYEDMVKQMSLNDIAYREGSLHQMVKSGIEDYKMVFIVVHEGEFCDLGQNGMWDLFYETAPIGTIVLLVAMDQHFFERKWEHIAPSTSLWAFNSLCQANSHVRLGVK